jgi:5-methylcytosine-specific restriction protein A
MPRSPPRVCAHAGCGAVAYGTHCAAHQADTRQRWANPKHRERGGSRQARGYGAAWEKLRATVLREEPLCRACLPRVTAASTVDHIVPKSEGGSDDRSNLRALCRECHARKSSAEGRRARTAT